MSTGRLVQIQVSKHRRRHQSPIQHVFHRQLDGTSHSQIFYDRRQGNMREQSLHLPCHRVQLGIRGGHVVLADGLHVTDFDREARQPGYVSRTCREIFYFSTLECNPGVRCPCLLYSILRPKIKYANLNLITRLHIRCQSI